MFTWPGIDDLKLDGHYGERRYHAYMRATYLGVIICAISARFLIAAGILRIR